MSSVSVIIPNYNRASLVGETIRNVLEQSLPPAEVIVVDDGSQDDSVAVIRAFGSRVRLLVQENRGPGAARNAGLAQARGEFVQFQDSDDLLSRNKLEVQARLLEASGADVAFSPWVKVRLEAGRARLKDVVLQQSLPAASQPLVDWFLQGWSTVFQSLLFRRALLARAGGYRTDLMPSEDSEYFVRLLLQQPRVAFSGEGLMLYREHSQQKITADGTSRARRVLDWARYLGCVQEDCARAGVSLARRTRQAMQMEAYSTWRVAGALGDGKERQEALRRLENLMAGARRSALAARWWFRRVRTAWQVRASGARWHPAYHAGPPTPAQLELIRQLGYQV